MNGPQDLGGMMGFGPIAPEADEPVFHAAWEKRALAITLAAGATGYSNIDEGRHARETLPWTQYLGTSYYEIWIAALEKLLNRYGMLDGPPQALRVLKADAVTPMLAKGTSYSRAVAMPPRFAPGDNVRTTRLQKEGHTRLPGYLRGVTGVVVRHHGGFVFPDTNADKRETAEHLYTVRFSAGAVFGGNNADTLHADLFEPYLEPT